MWRMLGGLLAVLGLEVLGDYLLARCSTVKGRWERAMMMMGF